MTQLNIKRNFSLVLAFVALILISACKKEKVDGSYIGDNEPPYYDGIATVLVQNYVNRIYIDLIGREPLDVEMEADVAYLKSTSLSWEARDSIIARLQEDTTFREGDSSYKAAYFNRLYELFKVKMLEGASDGDVLRDRNMIYGNLVRDSLVGNWYGLALNWQRINKLDNVVLIDEHYRDDVIDLKQCFSRLLDNVVYDRINMNTFNFLNASFQDLFDRYPTTYEFDNGFEIIENDFPGIIFGQSASNKGEFIKILVNSREFYEGMVRWAYGTLLVRDPSKEEMEKAMRTFFEDHDLPKLQKSILITDEYANFI
jgi:hypothetical protein